MGEHIFASSNASSSLATPLSVNSYLKLANADNDRHRLAQPSLPMLTAARAYLKHGFSVIPVNTETKAPCVNWREYQTRRPTDNELCEWWKEFPYAGVAIVTGKISGIAAVDIDGHTGHCSIRKNKLTLPITPYTTTPSGGFHMIYRHPHGKKVVTMSHAYPSVDVRGDGGYIIAPPSMRAEGGYEWVETLGLGDIELADLPEWVLTEPDEDFPRININPWKVAALQTDELRRIAHLLNIPSNAVDRLGSSFPCVLPGHNEKKPSASLYIVDDGTIFYRDWHERDCKKLFRLPEVYAYQRHQRVVKLSSIEYRVWETRMFFEAGIQSLPEVRMLPLPKSTPHAHHAVYNGFNLLLRCKMSLSEVTETSFSGRFASAWCGVSHVTANTAMRSFLQQGLITKVEEIPSGYGHNIWIFRPSNGVTNTFNNPSGHMRAA